MNILGIIITTKKKQDKEIREAWKDGFRQALLILSPIDKKYFLPYNILDNLSLGELPKIIKNIVWKRYNSLSDMRIPCDNAKEIINKEIEEAKEESLNATW